MARRVAALKPQLNRIRAWAHEGSTDAWIAHQLETTAEAVRAFRQEHGIERGGPAPLAPITPDSVVEAMLAEEAAALEAGPEPIEPVEFEEPEESSEAASEDEPVRAPRRRSRRPVADEVEGPEVATSADGPAAEELPETEAGAPAKPSRRRGARGGAGRSTTAAAPHVPAEAEGEEPAVEADAAVPQADEEPGRSPRKRGRRRGRGRGGSRGLEARLLPGSVLLLDAAVTTDPTFQEHWADAGALRVEVSSDAIVLRRIAADPEPDRSQG
jgi:hypothetical protein